MKIKQHLINHQTYEGEEILITKQQSLDQIVYDYYKSITTDPITAQSWTACDDMFTLVSELNPDVNSLNIQAGERLFMPTPIIKSADARVKLWD